jgi:hypothetical protein
MGIVGRAHAIGSLLAISVAASRFPLIPVDDQVQGDNEEHMEFLPVPHRDQDRKREESATTPA